MLHYHARAGRQHNTRAEDIACSHTFVCLVDVNARAIEQDEHSVEVAFCGSIVQRLAGDKRRCPNQEHHCQ